MNQTTPVPPSPVRTATDQPSAPEASAGYTPPPASPERDPAPDPRPRPVGWGLALIAAGSLWLLSLAGVPMRWDLVLPGALVVIGVLLLTGGRWTVRSGLIGLGVVVAVLALAIAVRPATPSISAGDRTYAVTDLADLDETYRLGAGSLTLDLRELELPEGTTELTGEVGMGELVVHVPPDVTIDGEGRVGLGEVVAFEQSRGGIAPMLAFTEPGDESDRVLELELRVGLGSIEVVR